jgi:hypothetical protein
MKKYTIYAYKHYWPDHLNDPDSGDIPVPYSKDERDYVIEAESEKEAIKIAEENYGSGERTTEDGKYIPNSDGSWTLMGVKKVEVLK